jgi:hypothetical protein
MELSWPGTVHLICEWHFIKNVKEKLKSRLGTAWKASAAVKGMLIAVGYWYMPLACICSTTGRECITRPIVT